ncbi:ROK family protein [Vannielia litorea]|uniref:Sugar kinase of the NBD/HSP70 family, may contain an N-terminal HTH domain n=1 Tax=Vannielia litorea TaxID=1217970 RepID=A0A1N6G3T9_9RHOB|nr:ROK family protein [Vannielia litorea]SIO02188.1 Sugar kinase of the NBD/HSP70 family, may contain an N-terminal HTH domain [Vannielia litorea]
MQLDLTQRESGDTALSAGCGPIRRGNGTEASGPLRRLAYERIRSAGQIARVDLARELDVSPATVTAVVAELLGTALVEEVEGPARPGARGRPPVALRVRGEAGYVIGMKLAEFKHTAVLTDMAGNTLASGTLARPSQARSLKGVLEEAATLAGDVITRAGVRKADVIALGAGLPGLIDHPEGLVLWSSVLEGEGVPLASRLSDALGIPTWIDNDTNLLTLAELWFGRGRSARDFAVVSIEQGVGMGLVLGQGLYRGAHSLALELGHTKVQLDGALCRCGQRGCLEAYTSDYALVREAHTALELDSRLQLSPQMVLESLHDRAKAGNEAARSIFRRAGRYMAAGLANVINLFDPSLIILSGERMQYQYLYAEEVMREMEELIVGRGRKAPEVAVNAWGDLVWARGAAALALEVAADKLAGRGAS